MTTIQIITLTTAIIGAVCGILGAVLGIINTYFQIQRKKVRIKVIPQYCIPVGSLTRENVNFSIEVINLSEFAINITDVGFLLNDGRKATSASVHSIENPKSLPIKLEPRASYSKLFHDSSCYEAFQKGIKSAYAQTACGNTIEGSSPALKHLAKQIKVAK